MLEIMDRDDLKRFLGPFPIRCPLDAVVLETADCGLYVRETIEYTVEADERVKSFLLVPSISIAVYRLSLRTISMRASFIWE